MISDAVWQARGCDVDDGWHPCSQQNFADRVRGTRSARAGECGV